jgi:hypothetical protein
MARDPQVSGDMYELLIHATTMATGPIMVAFSKSTHHLYASEHNGCNPV